MQGLPFVLLFTALTFLSWGAYGPLLRYGTNAMGHDGLKAFVGVGLAYFVIAVLVPFWILQSKGEKGKWTFVGTTYSIIAGSVGAIGALGIILALVFKGDPVFVMPLVFGFAPIVNTLVTAWMGGTLNKIKPVFVGGIIAAALGASGVLYFKPSNKPAPAHAQTSHDKEPESSSSSKTTTSEKSSSTNNNPAIDPSLSAKAIGIKKPEPKKELEKQPSQAESESAKPTTPAESKTADAKPIEAKPLYAASPAEGLPPVPTPIPAPTPAAEVIKPLVAALPDSGQPPIPDKITSDKPTPVPTVELFAALPDLNAQPPKPDTTPQEIAPKEAAPKKEEPKTSEPTVAPGKELPPPVPNPEADLSELRSQSRLRFVSAIDRANATEENTAEENSVANSKEESESHAPSSKPSSSSPNPGMIALSILMAALCWGSYGPMLHQGQMKMGGSRLRPFACVGIAYFIIAVAVPLVLLYTTPTISQGAWTINGMFWSVIAGGAGAIGALGIILAFNAGGKPIYVMPLVFGFAPVINTFISLTEAGTWSKVDTMFWVSLGVVIAGAITVLTTAPKAAHGPAHAPAAAGAK